MRFEYKPPSAVLVVSDGIDVAVFNKKLNTTDRYPLSTTPLNILLSDHVNLRENKIRGRRRAPARRRSWCMRARATAG